ncbi:MAG TPA: hypothetical protein VIH91_03025 [Terriglobales bacterium]
MISPILRGLGALAGLGSAILCWFLGDVLSAPTRKGQLLHLDVAHYELIAFLLVPALVLAIVAVFWVPPRPDGQGPAPEGARLRLLLVFIFLGAFLFGFAH